MKKQRLSRQTILMHALAIGMYMAQFKDGDWDSLTDEQQEFWLTQAADVKVSLVDKSKEKIN